MKPGSAFVKGNPVAALRQLAKPRARAESCEFCSIALSPAHRHVLEVPARKILCSCDGCALRFDGVVGRYKLIPRDTFTLPEFEMSDADWEALGLPIQLAFFVHSTPANRTLALYPSPAGVTESLLPLASWKELVAVNPELGNLEADVQALVVNRTHGAREYYLAPLDVCFELAGLVRMHWRGFSGGDKVWNELARFFARLRENALVPAREATEAVNA